jgi:hypothetical protein
VDVCAVLVAAVVRRSTLIVVYTLVRSMFVVFVTCYLPVARGLRLGRLCSIPCRVVHVHIGDMAVLSYSSLTFLKKSIFVPLWSVHSTLCGTIELVYGGPLPSPLPSLTHLPAFRC